MTAQPPPYPSDQPPGAFQAPGTFVCPKCRGTMRTYNRNGIHIEQCDGCRGLFLDFGEFESLSRMETQYLQQPPPVTYGPGWGQHGSHKYRKRGMAGLFFSS